MTAENGGVLSKNDEGPNAAKDGNDDSKTNAERVQGPISVVINNSPIAKNENEKPAKKHERRIETLALFAALGGIGAAIFAGIQALVSNQGNAITRSGYVTVQRAFVTISEFRVEMRDGLAPSPPGQPGVPTKYWTFIPVMKNSGTTPTKNLRYLPIGMCNITIFQGQGGFSVGPRTIMQCDPEVNPIDPADHKGQISRYPLGPQAQAPLGSIAFDPTYIDKMRTTGLRAYSLGIVQYNDFFENTPPHVTKYCFEIAVDFEGKPSYGLCAHWNCVDEECKNDRDEWEKEVAEGKIPKPNFPPPSPR
jgi:hypothetical protein